jgi:hypothetical protein
MKKHVKISQGAHAQIRDAAELKPEPDASGGSGPPHSTTAVTVATADPKDAGPLTAEERAELKVLEKSIAKGWTTFVEVGTALALIRDRRLYRETFKTFEVYVRSKWQFGRAHCYRLLGAAEIVGVLSPIGDKYPLPRNEWQVRPLIGLRPEEVRAAWQAAVGLADGKEVTARLVAQAAVPFRPTAVKARKPPCQVTTSAPSSSPKPTADEPASPLPLELLRILMQLHPLLDRALTEFPSHASALENFWQTQLLNIQTFRAGHGPVNGHPDSNEGNPSTKTESVQAL